MRVRAVCPIVWLRTRCPLLQLDCCFDERGAPSDRIGVVGGGPQQTSGRADDATRLRCVFVCS